jgi:aldose 1-epimerase
MSTSTDVHPDDPDIELEHGSFGLRISPFGASLRGFWQVQPDGSRRDIVTSYSGRENKVGGQGDVLIPFPGRIKAGAYTFRGAAYQLECNDREGPNAIHGFLRSSLWRITDQSRSHVQFSVDFDAQSHMGYPFSLHSELTYTLADRGLTSAYRICNVGDCTAPVAAGFHPYFAAGEGPINDWTLQLPFTGMLEFENLIPTGKILPVDGTAFDFRSPRKIGATQLNTCFVNPICEQDGITRVRLSGDDGKTTIIWTDSALNYVVLYSGDPLPEPHRRNSLAVEPMTCGSDGFNHPEWGLISLEPGASTSGSWGATV